MCCGGGFGTATLDPAAVSGRPAGRAGDEVRTEIAAAARAFFDAEAPLSSLRPHLEDGPAFDRSLWRRFCQELGGARLMLGPAHDGLEAGVEEAALVAEAAGRVLYGGPYLHAWLVGVLLEGVATEAPRLERVAAGDEVVAVVLAQEWARAVPAPSGGWLLDAAPRPVELLDSCDALLVSADDGSGTGLFLVGRTALDPQPSEHLDLTRRSGLLGLRSAPAVRVELPAPEVALRVGRARTLDAVLRAAEGVGSLRAVHGITTAYAASREQFGRTIASFQAVKHDLAELHVDGEAAAAVAAEAVRAVSEDPMTSADSPEVLAAGLVVEDALFRTTHRAIQLHGGIGFTWEHDAHLFHRRAIVARGSSGPRAARLARLLEPALRQELEEPRGEEADEAAAPPASRQPTELDRFRLRAREWLVQAVAAGEAPETRPGPPSTAPAGVAAARRHQAALQAAGFSGITYPVEYGGAGLGPEFEETFFEETVRTGAGEDKLFRIGTGMIGPAILALGDEAQRRRYLPPLLRGDEVWCELFSEPGSGSDMAAASTRAVADGDDFVVTGQKVWTSNAHLSDLALLLARTDPTAPKHAGLSMFLVPMDAPGVEVRPLRQITGETEFNEVFLDRVRVPRTALLGELHGGWRVARLVLQHERQALGSTAVRRVVLADLVAAAERAGIADDPAVRTMLAEQVLRERRLRAYVDRLASGADAAGPPAEAGSVAKLLMTRALQGAAHLAADLLAGSAAAWDPDRDVEVREMLDRVLAAEAFSIAGGTDNILRNLIGERVLGLPRG